MKATRLTALLLTAALLTACGEGGPASPEARPAPVSPAASQAEPPPAQPAGQLSLYGGTGSLEEFRYAMSERYPECIVGLGSLGWLEGPYGGSTLCEALQTDGFWPFVRDIGWEEQLGGYDQRGHAWLIVPLDPAAAVTVSRVSWGENASLEVGETLYTSREGRPLVLITDALAGWPEYRVTVTDSEGLPAELYPICDRGCEVLRPELPASGGVFDCTYRPGTLPAADWDLMRPWLGQDSGGWFEGQSRTDSLLRLDPAWYASYELLDAGGGLLAHYEGGWSRSGDNTLTLDLALTQKADSASAALPGTIAGEYHFLLGPTGTLALSWEAGATPPVSTGDPLGTGASFALDSETLALLHREPTERERQACDTVLAYYGTGGDYADTARPVGYLGDDVVVQLTATAQAHSEPRGWYTVNPETRLGLDYATGETVDYAAALSGSALPDAELYGLMDRALNYYETRYNYRPGSVSLAGQSEAGVTLQLYDDMGTHTATCAWYTIDPVTLQGTDDITGEVIDFSDYEGVG